MPLLSAESITVRFGGIAALHEADVTVDAGGVTGLIGPNGAGKTTLFNVISGLQAPTHGRVVLDGTDITGASPFRRARMGIARTFQKLEAFGSLSAHDNVLVAAEQRRAWSRDRIDPRAVADDLLERCGISDVARFMVGTLPTGTARRVELARALATEPRVLLLDEPSSGLNEDETEAMAALLGDFAADGLGVLLVEHDMSFVMGACEHIHVLDFGTVIATGPPSEIQGDPAVQVAYLGSAAVDG
ncbi:ABC transporter ATP-binding protein [cyanobacterium TDX16]|nr:ABC transporter ATP-binding protein [cyanobacterium TDX16]